MTSRRMSTQFNLCQRCFWTLPTMNFVNIWLAAARAGTIPFKLDILYPFYGSDASAAMSAGTVSLRSSRAGIGVSHSYEEGGVLTLIL